MQLNQPGERYTETLPDTLDLADRARLAVHGIMGSIDPDLLTMCGSDEMVDLQERYFDSLLARLQDGLYWDLRNPRRPWRNSYSSAFYGAGKDEDFCCTAGAGRMIRTLMAWRAISGSDRFDGPVRELVQGLLRGVAS